jgi:hypothetical protein
MATQIITGRDITFTIDGVDYDAQATSATLTVDTTVNTYQTLDGKAYFSTDTQGTLLSKCLPTGEPHHQFAKLSGQLQQMHQTLLWQWCSVADSAMPQNLHLMSNQSCHQLAELHQMRKQYRYHLLV